MTIKFYWNGFKASDGKLVRCFYSQGPWTGESNLPEGTIKLYRRDYGQLSRETYAEFSQVQNETEIQSDYIVTDSLVVTPANKHYSAVKAAIAAKEARNLRRYGAQHVRAA